MLKTCFLCKESLDVSNFNTHAKRKDGYQSQCKKCHAEYRHKHYLKNKQKYYDKSLRNKGTFDIWWADYKSKLKCNRCSENHPGCLHFHHIDPSKKEYNLSKLAADCSKRRILEEVKKCEVLCANCHGKHHYEERRKNKVLFWPVKKLD